MSKAMLAGILLLGLAACAPAAGKDAASNAAITVGSRPAPPARRTLNAGTLVEATIQDSLNSRTDKAGRSLSATVSSDVKDANGNVVIPAGSAVLLNVAQLQAATNKSQADGKLALTVTSLTVRGQVYQVNAQVASTPHKLVGRGVTAGEIEKAGGGAVIGAVAGRVIGGNTKGAVIGGVVGGAAGTAVAVHFASRDVVVTPGTQIVFSLSQPLTVATR